ncbi:hypothetical protein METHB2_500004 [Candidatus Methylobacter favarea]|uniref:Uncharacterized protein n=1 Tax=Candidatus Methylobacter favarea TaxID=2707345 RepID=A0A8S0X949_9GAMM|nr:hypothetical protein METHB2_500004 [Candidatus Methylobacter favarea]
MPGPCSAPRLRRPFDAIAALIGFLALLALLRYQAGVVPVIAVWGAAGFLFTFVKPWLAPVGVFL